MSLFHPCISLDPSTPCCGQSAEVTVSFCAGPDFGSADVVLALDRSGSLRGRPLAEMKTAAKDLLNILANASGGCGTLENGCRAALVSFADTARKHTELTNELPRLERAVDSLLAGGFTNHSEAFRMAEAILRDSRAARRILILFTDGKTNVGGSACAPARRLRELGVEIYCVGLMEDWGPLLCWASDPGHVAAVREPEQLRSLFCRIAAQVVQAGSLGMSLVLELNPGFEILDMDEPSHGCARAAAPGRLVWKAPAVGVCGMETACLKFRIAVGAGGKIFRRICFRDQQGHCPDFPDPCACCNCPEPVPDCCPCPEPEDCPPGQEFLLDSCESTICIRPGDTVISHLGRVIQAELVLKNICPHRQTAAAVILTELDGRGREYDRGMKTVLVPAHSGPGCRDVRVPCIRFAVPEALSCTGSGDSLCRPRRFRIRVIANYTGCPCSPGLLCP